ncbi:MAG: hypothetical protein WD871_12590 [Xanthobacteraceae bacterium]
MSTNSAIGLPQSEFRSRATAAQDLDESAASWSNSELAQRGFVHIRSIVPSARVDEFKRLAIEHGDATNIHRTPIFDILVDEFAVHRIVQEHVGKDVYYFGRSNIRPADTAKEHHYHDDAKGFPIAVDAPPNSLIRTQSDPHDITQHPIWPVYRLFIYLDDHETFSGGTKFRTGSHRRHALFSKNGFRALAKFRFKEILIPGAGYVNPPVRPGDAILFSLKCKHSGYFVRLRRPFDHVALPTFWDNVIKRVTLSTRLGRSILSLIARPFRETRTSVIIDFCTESDWSRGLQVNRLLHPNNLGKWDQMFDCNRPEFVARLAKSGVRVLNNPSLRRLEAFLTADRT